MGYDDGRYETRVRFGPSLTPAVKTLILVNVAVFGLEILLRVASVRALNTFLDLFALQPDLALQGLRVWQFITYSFLHDVNNVLHIGFNMVMLWMFGSEVEAALGSRRFLRLYFGAALAGGICMIPWYHSSILGASGAVFGCMAIFARLFPRRLIYIWGVVPVRARTLAIALVVIELLVSVGGKPGTAHFAHLGGFAGGYLFLRVAEARSPAGRFRAQLAPKPKRVSDTDIERWRRIDAGALHPVNREELERVMAKVNAEGIPGLTPGEREFLERFSAR